MAKRRMMSKDIIDTDLFLDMSQGSQNLYFHFLLRADDDGFIASPKKIMRMLGIADDDFSVLIAKKFIIPFKSGVCVIKHWKIHNYIQKDRYTKTCHVEEMALLSENSENVYRMDTECIQNVEQSVSTGKSKVRLGKSKVSLSCDQRSQKKERSPVEQIIDVFYDSVNPTINYGNKTSRSAAEWLIKKYTLPKAIAMCQKVCIAQSPENITQFTPTCTTPNQLKESIAKWVLYFQKQEKVPEHNKRKITKVC